MGLAYLHEIKSIGITIVSNLAFVVLQMGAFRDRSVQTLRKVEKKRSDEVLQKPDGAPGGIRTPDGLILE